MHLPAGRDASFDLARCELSRQQARCGVIKDAGDDPDATPTRGMAHVLPTGRNFYAIDPRSMPSRSAWRVGQQLATELVERHLRDTVAYPRSVGLSIWGTSAMRTHGDDIAQVFSLLGVRPVWQTESQRLIGTDVVPPGALGRPRVDVACRISGFFRDAFPHVLGILDDAIRSVGVLDESAEDNPLCARVLADTSRLEANGLDSGAAERRALYRVFGSKPGTYGAGILPLIDEGNWQTGADFATARICTAFEVDGLRADIVIYKTASTLAAYAGRERVTAEDVCRAAELALPHRRRRLPFDQPGLDRERLDEIVGEHSSRSSPRDEPAEPRPDCDDDDEPPPRDPPDGQNPGGAPAESSEHLRGGKHAEPVEHVFVVTAVSPPPPPPTSAFAARGTPTQRSSRRAGPVVESPRGRHVRSSPARISSLDVVATLRAAAPQQAQCRRVHADQRDWRIQLKPADLRFKVRARPIGALTVFAVDASGSMAARRRMALAKGAVLSLLERAYQKRDEVAMIAFRGSAAEVLLPPTSSVHLASVRLRALPTGGRTPLALALTRAGSVFAQRASDCSGRARIPTLVLVSDGRANVALAGGDPYADALTQARVLRAAGVGAVVVDTEDGPTHLGRARVLAVELGATYVRLSDLSAGTPPDNALAATVRNQPWGMR